MSVVEPHVIIRMGTHAEKRYVLKTANLLDGVIIGANLVEATPAATASLIAHKLSKSFFIDPMTYAFGNDLDLIKSSQAKTGVSSFKRSYCRLSEHLGGPFHLSLQRSAAIVPSDFSSAKDAHDMCRAVADYQRNRIPLIFLTDPEYEEFADEIRKLRPAGVFAPYFYIDGGNRTFSIEHQCELGMITARLGLDVPVHIVVCAANSLLSDARFIDKLISQLPRTG
ncbi:MAG: hypothetical protein HQ592_01525, partial [Planctomycetes bacterium]|nr:hypothetical protein [Planctomycetota bacterium]